MAIANPHRSDAPGLAAAAALIGTWLALLATGLAGATASLGVSAVVAHMLLATLSATGMFITAHDAIHGLVAPQRPRLNEAIGTLAMMLYAGMSYRRMAPAHHRHHALTGTAEDPDHHEHPRGGMWRWYFGFMREHATVTQVIVMAVAYNVLQHIVGVPQSRLWLFWIIPQIASSLQLFIVGTWLPHRQGTFEGDPRHHARSLHLPPSLSLLACFHFGYHYEHHEWPSIPWYRLPAAYRARRTRSSTAG